MSFTVERNGYVSVQVMGRAIADDLIANGFTLIAVNGSDVGPATSDSSNHYVFQPTASVDPTDQSWRLVMEATDADDGFIRFWACHELQINTDTWRVVNNGLNSQSGHMFLGNDVGSDSSKLLNRQHTSTNWSCYAFEGIDPRAIPLSYRLSISDHGVSLFMWAEAFDRAGDCFSWFTVQRPVEKDGTVVASGKLPLFCVFSWQGGGDTNVALNEDLNAVGHKIQQFVVYESDILAPSAPLSACITGPDSKAIINPIQQIGLAEDNKYTVFFPQGVTTQRYVYPYELDMIAFTSADVISQNETAEVTLYGEGTPRKYIGMQANFPNNSGMRMLCLIEGSGIPAAP